MKIHIIAAFSIILFSSAAFAASDLTTDENGNVTGTIDGKKVNMRTDQFGNTRGTIGGEKVKTHTDKFGNTTGTVGKTAIDTRADDAGNAAPVKIGKSKINALTDKDNETITGAPGTVGSSIVNTYLGNPANASGKVDHKNINKRSDSFGESFGE